MASAVEADRSSPTQKEDESFGEDLVVVTTPTGPKRRDLSSFDGYVEERLLVEVRLVNDSEEDPHRVMSLWHSDDVVTVVWTFGDWEVAKRLQRRSDVAR